MQYYLIAGEASGDLHGANLITALGKSDPNAAFRGYGGNRMVAAGMTLVTHYKAIAFMGFVEVIKNLKTILSYIRSAKKDILEQKPDVIILIDYPGFNLRIAKWAKNHGFKIVYYITPQVWAWHKNRVHALNSFTDKLLVILPFEKDFFSKYNYDSVFVGHPLLDAIHEHRSTQTDVILSANPIIALLPGSRKQEVVTMLPVYLDAVKDLDYDIFVATTSSLDPFIYRKIIAQKGLQNKVKLLTDQTYTLLSNASLALVSSGTATLETALFGIPQIVCYKGNQLSFFIAKRLVKLKYISLVNLICGEEIVKELIQNDLTAENIKSEINAIEMGKGQQIKIQYTKLIQLLGEKGASEKAALEIIKLLKPENE